jgi:hypothetical protein
MELRRTPVKLTSIRDEKRRDSERVDVVWTGRCGPARTPEWEWSECALVDTSANGARLVVPPTTCYRVGTDDDGTYVGIELTFTSLQQQRTAEMLFGRRS